MEPGGKGPPPGREREGGERRGQEQARWNLREELEEVTELGLVREEGDGEDITEASGGAFQGRRMLSSTKYCGELQRRGLNCFGSSSVPGSNTSG